MTRSASDNFNLDLLIAERFGMTLDQVDALPLGLVEIVRAALWDCDHDFEPVDGDNSDTATAFKCNNCRVEAVKGGHEQCNHTFKRCKHMINVCTKCGLEGEQD